MRKIQLINSCKSLNNSISTGFSMGKVSFFLVL